MKRRGPKMERGVTPSDPERGTYCFLQLKKKGDSVSHNSQTTIPKFLNRKLMIDGQIPCSNHRKPKQATRHTNSNTFEKSKEGSKNGSTSLMKPCWL